MLHRISHRIVALPIVASRFLAACSVRRALELGAEAGRKRAAAEKWRQSEMSSSFLRRSAPSGAEVNSAGAGGDDDEIDVEC